MFETLKECKLYLTDPNAWFFIQIDNDDFFWFDNKIQKIRRGDFIDV